MAGKDTVLDNGLVCLPGNCLHQAIKNYMYYKKNLNKELHISIGGLCLGDKSWIWCPNGLSRAQWDYHVWLEDEERRIYDIITPIITKHASADDVQIVYKDYEIINGESRQTLDKMGLKYVYAQNASLDIQESNITLLIKDKKLVLTKEYPTKLLSCSLVS